MPADTLALPRNTDAAGGRQAPTGQFELVPDRAVIELVVRILGLPMVRLRLRAVAGGLHLTGAAPGTDADDVSDATPAASATGLLWADVAPKPIFASLPLIRRRRLTPANRATRISLTTSRAAHPPGAGDTVRLAATITAGAWSRAADVDVRFVILDEQVAVLAVRGRIGPSRDTPLVKSLVWIDAAGEFVR